MYLYVKYSSFKRLTKFLFLHNIYVQIFTKEKVLKIFSLKKLPVLYRIKDDMKIHAIEIQNFESTRWKLRYNQWQKYTLHLPNFKISLKNNKNTKHSAILTEFIC